MPADAPADDDIALWVRTTLDAVECRPGRHLEVAVLLTDAGDMDAWGYSFRLGSTERWFEHDADDARDWLFREGLISASNGRVGPSFTLRD